MKEDDNGTRLLKSAHPVYQAIKGQVAYLNITEPQQDEQLNQKVQYCCDMTLKKLK
jgi:hypothetical protein